MYKTIPPQGQYHASQRRGHEWPSCWLKDLDSVAMSSTAEAAAKTVTSGINTLSRLAAMTHSRQD